MAVNTKQALAQSFRRLLAQRTLDKITVKDIVEDCGVNRQTFYYHFHDIYDLLEWVVNEIETTTTQNLEENDWFQGVDQIAEQMLANKRLLLNAYHSISHETVTGFIKDRLRRYMVLIVDQRSEGLRISPEAKRFVIDLFTLGAAGFLTEWVEQQMNVDKLADLHRLKQYLDSSLDALLRQFSV